MRAGQKSEAERALCTINEIFEEKTCLSSAYKESYEMRNKKEDI